MLIPDGQTNEGSLAIFGAEAVGLLCSGNFADLAERFGYALTFNRHPAAAILEDLSLCLAQLHAARLRPAPSRPAVKVRYFARNDAGLFAVVECLIPTDKGSDVLLELVVTSKGADKHVSLEQISAAAEPTR